MKKRKGLPKGYKTHQRKKHINKSPQRRGEKTAVGTFLGTRRGFGFVRDESGRLSEDVFIPKHETKGALHGDTVRISYREKFPSGIEGRVTEIVEKSAKTVVGTLIGFYAVRVATVILPFALAFAGGTMLYVISDEMIPETHAHGHQRGATYALLVGFCVMLACDVLLGG